MSSKGKNSEWEQHFDESDRVVSRIPDNESIVLVR
jgi:hypothetical protein